MVTQQKHRNIEQISLFNLRDDITKNQFDKMVDDTNSLITTIPGVESVKIDRNMTEPWIIDPIAGFSHALRIRFSSRNALRFYQDHPMQIGVQNTFLNSCTDGNFTTFYFETMNAF